MKRKIWELGNHSCGNTPSPAMLEKGCGLCFMENKKWFLPVQACYKGTSKACHGAKRQGGWETVAIFPCSLGRLPEGGEIWAVGPGPPHLSWPGLCQCSHPCVLIPWKPPFLGPARCTHGNCPFLTFPGPPYTSQRTGSPQNKEHFQVVRARARAQLIGSETSSEQWPRRKLGHRNACPPPTLLLAEATVSPISQPCGSQPMATLPCPSPPSLPPSLIPRPKRKAALLAAKRNQHRGYHTGCNSRCRLLQWLLVLKPRGQNRGLCLWLETQQGHRGICHHLKPRYGRAGSLGAAHGSELADLLRGLDLQGTGLLRWK